jgi:hypothetical protein
MELKIRKLEEKDWSVLPTWWEQWPAWQTPTRDALPDNGIGGLMVEKNGKQVLAGFIYETNSKGVWLEFIISDPEYREEDRQEALELLITTAEGVALEAGFKYVLFIGKHTNLINTFESLGFTVDRTPSYELMKKISN